MVPLELSCEGKVKDEVNIVQVDASASRSTSESTLETDDLATVAVSSRVSDAGEGTNESLAPDNNVSPMPLLILRQNLQMQLKEK